MITVLLADDQQLIRASLAALLDLEDDLSVVGEVADGEAAVGAAIELRPDVVLLDIEMPVLDGISATARIHQALPDTRVMILTTFGRPGYLRKAMDAGARAYVVKDTRPDQLITMIRQVVDGQVVLDPDLAIASLQTGPDPLTDREKVILAAAANGLSAAGIAKEQHLSVGTVRNYLSSAITKTAAKNSTEAARIARDRGWL